MLYNNVSWRYSITQSGRINATLYLAHSFHILGLSKSFNLLLSVIVNEKLAHDIDVRRLIILIARAIEPRDAELYIDIYGVTFRRRYNRD